MSLVHPDIQDIMSNLKAKPIRDLMSFTGAAFMLDRATTKKSKED